MDDYSARGITRLVNASIPGRDSISLANLAAASSVTVEFSEASTVVTPTRKKNDREFLFGETSPGHMPLNRFHVHSEKRAKPSEKEIPLSLWSAFVAGHGLSKSSPSITSTLKAPPTHPEAPVAAALSPSANQSLKLPSPIQLPSMASGGSASSYGPRTMMVPASCTASIRHLDRPDRNGSIHRKILSATSHSIQTVLPRQRSEDTAGTSVTGSTFHEGDELASIMTTNDAFNVEDVDEFAERAAHEESKAQEVLSPTHGTYQELEKTPRKKSEQEQAQEAHKKAKAAAHMAAQDRDMKIKARGELHGQVARRRSSTIHPRCRMSRMSVSGDELPNDLRFPQEPQNPRASSYTGTPSLEEDISPMTQEPHALVGLNAASVAFRGLGSPHQEAHKVQSPWLISKVPASPAMQARRSSDTGLNASDAKDRNDKVRAAMCAMSVTGTTEGVMVVRRMPPTPSPPSTSMASPAPSNSTATMRGRHAPRTSVAGLEDDFQVKAGRNDNVRAAMSAMSAFGTTEGPAVVRRMPLKQTPPPASMASPAPSVSGATMIGRHTSRKSVASLEDDFQVKTSRNETVRAIMSSMPASGATEGVTVVRRMPPNQYPPPPSMASPVPCINGATMMDHRTARKSVASLEDDFQVEANRNDNVQAVMSANSDTRVTEGLSVVRRMPINRPPPPASMASPAPSASSATMMGRRTSRKSVASLEDDFQVKTGRNDNVRAIMSSMPATGTTEGLSVVRRMPPTPPPPPVSMTSPDPSIGSATMMGRRTARKTVACLEDDSQVKADQNDNVRAAMSANGGTRATEGISVVRRMPPTPPPPPATMASPAPSIGSATMMGRRTARKSVASLEDDFQVKAKARDNFRSSRGEDGVEPWVVMARKPPSLFSSTSATSATSSTGSVMGMTPKPPSARSPVSSVDSVSSGTDWAAKTRHSLFASCAARPPSLRSSTSATSTTGSVMGSAPKPPSLSSFVSIADSVSSGLELDAETRNAIIASSTARRSLQESGQTRRSQGDAPTLLDLANLFRNSSFDSDSVADAKRAEGNHAVPNDLSQGKSSSRPCDEKSAYRTIRSSTESAMVRPPFDEKEAESAYRTNRSSSSSVIVRPPFDEKEAEYISRPGAYIVARTPPEDKGASQGLRLAAATWQESEFDGQHSGASLPHSTIFDMSGGEDMDHEVPSQVFPDVEVQAGVSVILPGAWAISGMDAGQPLSGYDSGFEENSVESMGEGHHIQDREGSQLETPGSSLSLNTIPNTAFEAELVVRHLVDGQVLTDEGQAAAEAAKQQQRRQLQIIQRLTVVLGLVIVLGIVLGIVLPSSDSKEQRRGGVDKVQGWTQLAQTLMGEEHQHLLQFGLSVSCSSDGNRLAIGVPGTDNKGDNKPNQGSVVVMDFDGIAWVKAGLIEGSDQEHKAGETVAISHDGKRIAVGSPNVGHVAVYEESKPYVWKMVGDPFKGDDQRPLAIFGKALAISADGKIIAFSDEGSEGGINAVKVQVFKEVNSTWVQRGGDIRDTKDSSLFGRSLDLSADGETIVASALGPEGSLGTEGFSGSVTVFRFDGLQWNQLGRVLEGEVNRENFGRSVALSDDGSIVAVGSSGYSRGVGDPSVGLVRVFKFESGDWVQMGESLEGQNKLDMFGSSVDLSSKGDILAIGGPENDTFGHNSGHARVMRFDGSLWTQIGSDLGVVSHSGGEKLGMDVSLSSDGSRIALGAPFANFDGLYHDVGQVVVFQVEDGYII